MYTKQVDAGTGTVYQNHGTASSGSDTGGGPQVVHSVNGSGRTPVPSGAWLPGRKGPHYQPSIRKQLAEKLLQKDRQRTRAGEARFERFMGCDQWVSAAYEFSFGPENDRTTVELRFTIDRQGHYHGTVAGESFSGINGKDTIVVDLSPKETGRRLYAHIVLDETRGFLLAAPIQFHRNSTAGKRHDRFQLTRSDRTTIGSC